MSEENDSGVVEGLGVLAIFVGTYLMLTGVIQSLVRATWIRVLAGISVIIIELVLVLLLIAIVGAPNAVDHVLSWLFLAFAIYCIILIIAICQHFQEKVDEQNED